jgi:hypothetical protein
MLDFSMMNKIGEMFIPSNTTYIILKFKLGYMFRLCGVIIRPLQFDDAVRHNQDSAVKLSDSWQAGCVAADINLRAAMHNVRS